MNKEKEIYRDCCKNMWMAYALLTINEIIAVGVSVCMAWLVGDFANYLLAHDIDKIIENILWILISVGFGTLLLPMLSLGGNTILFFKALDHDRLVFLRYLQLPLVRQKEITPGEVQYRLENDPDEFRWILLEMVRLGISIPFAIVMILYILPKSIGWIICLIAGIKFLTGNYLGKVSANSRKTERDINTDLRSYEMNICSNLLIYLCMGWGKSAQKLFSGLFRHNYKKNLQKAAATGAFVEELIAWMDVFIQLLLLLIGCIGIYMRVLKISDVVKIVVIFPTLEKVIKQIETCIRNRYNLQEVKKRMKFFYDREKKVSAPIKGEEIRVENVSFAYQDVPVLKDVHFILSKKKTVIYGENGTGKSTLLKLLCGFRSDYQGQIRIDDMLLRENEEGWLRELAYVSQDSMIFEGTLEENIAMTEEINNKCMRTIIEETSLGYLSGRIIKKDSVSGGEKQRISLARALYSNRDWIFMDEPDKHLDVATMHWLEEFIRKTDRKLVYVTHSERLKGYADQYIFL